MGLDNFFCTDPQNFFGTSLPFDTDQPHNLVVGGIAGSFRGKFYTPIVDVMLGTQNWLYENHGHDELVWATEKMNSYDLTDEKVWKNLIDSARKHPHPSSAWCDEYTAEEIYDLTRMFTYYSQMPSVHLVAWY
jgi:hypothetical protein